MEKQVFYHPLIVEDSERFIFFTCGILNNDGAKIETIGDLRATIKTFGDKCGSLNCNGCFKGNVLLNYCYYEEDGVDTFKLRYVDKVTGRIEELTNPIINPNYMKDSVDQIY